MSRLRESTKQKGDSEKRDPRVQENAPGGRSELMTYWVYEDDQTDWVRVHKETCIYCNDGQGRHRSRLPDNRWYGPCPTVRDAIDRALSTGRAYAGGCGECLQEVSRLRRNR